MKNYDKMSILQEDDMRVYTTIEMLREIYNDPNKEFQCVRDESNNDEGGKVRVINKRLC
jgi:hypothetical protein